MWGSVPYSLGGAYFIAPDEGSYLEELYRELGLDEVYRLSPGGDDPAELLGRIRDDFWSGAGLGHEERLAFRRYAEIVSYYAEDAYPDIPVARMSDAHGILALDRKTLRQDIEERMGMVVPEPLAGMIQSYCYSSFAAGWEEISAASGWNFLAAEEYGRWVFPGGTSYMARQLYEALAELDADLPIGCPPQHLRGGCNVVDVRLGRHRVQVTYVDAQGECRSLLAKRVVMANPKLTAKHVLHGLADRDPEKAAAMHQLEYRAYVVANVLLDEPVDVDFYDAFLHLGAQVPLDAVEAEAFSRVTDLLDGSFARREDPAQRAHALLAAALRLRALRRAHRGRLRELHDRARAADPRAARARGRFTQVCPPGPPRPLGPRHADRASRPDRRRRDRPPAPPDRGAHLLRQPGQLGAPGGRELPARRRDVGRGDRRDSVKGRRPS